MPHELVKEKEDFIRVHSIIPAHVGAYKAYKEEFNIFPVTASSI